MIKILLIEDEPSVLIAVRDSLESENYAVFSAADGREGLRLAVENEFNLIVLDLMLPGMSGLEICQRLREREIETPIIMLTARATSEDAAFGLKLGADDYIAKPFVVGEFLARVAAVLRRANKQKSEERIVKIGTVKLDMRRLRAERNGENLEISPREFEILELLIANRGDTVTREQLLRHIWGANASLYTRTIDAHIAHLRYKLEIDGANPQFIITVHRLGYRLV